MRSALGASRSQVLRPLFVESLLLAFAGGICAVFVARWTFDWMAAASAGESGVVRMPLTLDGHVLGSKPSAPACSADAPSTPATP